MKLLLITISCICLTGYPLSGANELDDAQDTANGVSIHPSSQSQPGSARMSIEKEFEMLYQSLKEIHADYYSDVMKTLAFLIIALGWFITSNKSREFFRKNRTARISSILAVAIICVIHIRFCILTYYSSQKLLSLLDGMNYIEAERYSSYAINIPQLATNLVQNVVLFGVLIVILCTLKETSSTP